MSSERFLNDKQLKKLDRELQQLISRIGIDRKTQDEVFDKSTLRTFEKLISNKVLDILDFPISTGKEGNVFRGVTPQGKNVAVKIYRTSTSTFKHMQPYIIGDPRFKSIHKSRRDLIYAWTRKEYKNLERLETVGVRAPKPIICLSNVLVMEYIGSSERPAPLLKDIVLDKPDEIFATLIDFITKMYKKANLVHGDLSVFNILFYCKKPYIIDLGQGVLKEHPNAHEFLRRDIYNIVSYFNKYNITADEKQIYTDITGQQW